MQPSINQQRSPARVTWLAVLILTLAIGATLIALSLLPYPAAKSLADGLARDHSMDSFTPEFFSTLTWGLRITGLLCILAAGLLTVYKEKFQETIERGRTSSLRRRIRGDLKELGVSFASGWHDKASMWALAAITVLAVSIRLIFISRPMLHDEAYTFVAFASRSLWTVIADYELPNNHVFHTILVYLAYHLLGNQPWVIRLPAFIAGVLCVPATYLTGNLLYNRKIALVGAALVASAPIMIEYSTNARGYTLICLFTLLVLSFAVYVKDHRNLIAWLAIVILASLGFYTIPVMLYPFGMVMLWLLSSTLLKDTPAYTRSSFLTYLILTVAGVAVFSALLYLPVFIQSGIQAVVANNFVRPLSYEALWESLRIRAANTRDQWLADLPIFVGYLSLIGFAASLFLHRRLSSQRVPLQLAAIVWIAAALSVQRVAPQARIWLFLLPIYLLWAVAGIWGILSLPFTPRLQKYSQGIALALAILLPLASLASAMAKAPIDQESAGVEEGITIYLKDHLKAGDLVVIQAPMATPLLYYFRQYEISSDYFNRDRTDIRRAFVVVSSKYDQTLEGVLNKKGLGKRFDLEQAIIVYHSRHITIYEVSPSSTSLLRLKTIVCRWSIQGTVLRGTYDFVDKGIKRN